MKTRTILVIAIFAASGFAAQAQFQNSYTMTSLINPILEPVGRSTVAVEDPAGQVLSLASDDTGLSWAGGFRLHKLSPAEEWPASYDYPASSAAKFSASVMKLDLDGAHVIVAGRPEDPAMLARPVVMKIRISDGQVVRARRVGSRGQFAIPAVMPDVVLVKQPETKSYLVFGCVWVEVVPDVWRRKVA